MKPKEIFIAWVNFQRRIYSMESYFQYEPFLIQSRFKRSWLKLADYLLKSIQTLYILVTQKPSVVWIQLPPSPLLYLVLSYKFLLLSHIQIIADCHNATFRKPWISSPFIIQLLNQCDLVLVHNESVLEQAIDLGISDKRLMVLRDRMIKSPSDYTIDFSTRFGPRPWILTPCSFNVDEPIEEIFQAADHAQDLTFIVTGNVARAKGKHNIEHISSNLILTGFLPKEEFDDLLNQCDLVLGLTKLDGIQLSVAGEAVSTGKPMVLSNTLTLKKLFYKGAVFVDSFNSKSIIQGCREVLARSDQLGRDVVQLREDSDRQWLEQARKVHYLIQ